MAEDRSDDERRQEDMLRRVMDRSDRKKREREEATEQRAVSRRLLGETSERGEPPEA